MGRSHDSCNLLVCSVLPECRGWVEGTAQFPGAHRDVPREYQIKPECLFLFVYVCEVGGFGDSLLIWLLQRVVFPVGSLIYSL